MIPRFYQDLEALLKSGKVVILYGPRRCGKTTLLEEFLRKTTLKYRLDSGDNIRIQNILGSLDFDKIIEYGEGLDLVAIDEAQQIPQIGQALKILVDQLPHLKVIATGSSSFDLSQEVGEPLTGRKRSLVMYPLAQMELLKFQNKFDLRPQLEDFLVFGSYPEVVTTKKRLDRIDILKELVNSYLFKDVLAMERIKGPKVLFDLVQLLAFRVGSLVSLNELATQLHLDVKTVKRYLDLLERSFIIHRLGGFSRNLRNEIKAKQKIYFLDNGVRNGVIGHFHSLDQRNDIGQLWENFVVTERLKWATYTRSWAMRYYWRTYTGNEIDFVEAQDGDLSAFEIKWSPLKKPKVPKVWQEEYPKTSFEVIGRDNYFDYIT